MLILGLTATAVVGSTLSAQAVVIPDPGSVGSDLATFIRTLVVIVVLGGILAITGQWRSPAEIPARTWIFLVLSGLATGASWLCYFRALKIGQAAQVAPVDKLSVVLVALFGALVLGERMSITGWVGVVLIASGAIMVAIA